MNPYLPEYEYIPDGEPHVFENRVYIYGSHDRFNGEHMCMNDYVCYSADVMDLENWRYEGVIYRANQDPRMAEGNRHLWAPDVIRGKDGRYYLFYCPNGDGECIGVAVCDTPAGEYVFHGIVHDTQGVPIGMRPQDTAPFDPAVFMDDDGTVYLYSGNGPLLKEYPPQFAHLAPPDTAKGCAVMVLDDNMLTVTTQPRLLIPHVKQTEGTSFEKHPFFEASSLRKIRGKYYLIYSSNKMHELCYAVSDYPDREFTFGGVLISNVEIHEKDGYDFARNAIGNNHGSILELDDEYYLFYHRATNNHGNSRQGCAERIYISDNGSIRQAEMTSHGMTGPFTQKRTYPASCVCHMYRSDIRTNSLLGQIGKSVPYLTQDAPDYQPGDSGKKPRQYITNLCNHGIAVFRYFRMPSVEKLQFVLRGTGTGTILLRQDPESEPFGQICMQESAEWEYYEISLPVPMDLNALCVCYEGQGIAQLLEFTIL